MLKSPLWKPESDVKVDTSFWSSTERQKSTFQTLQSYVTYMLLANKLVTIQGGNETCQKTEPALTSWL